jgi:hypothetical protein
VQVFFPHQNRFSVGLRQFVEIPSADLVPCALEFDQINPMLFKNMLKRGGMNYPVDAVV